MTRKWKHALDRIIKCLGGTPLGGISDPKYYSILEKVAKENYKKWGYDNEDEALVYLLNANDYDYRGYYNKYPESKANVDTPWTDEFKTVYHPTFSKESIYSGKQSQFNPRGTIGGRWDGLEYRPSYSLVFNNDFDFTKTEYYLRNSENGEYIDLYYLDIYDKAKELEKIKGAVVLNTYYPIVSSYPWTGHSMLLVSGLIPNMRGDALVGSILVNKGRQDKDYNLVTNNCSDATRCALEKIFGKKINPILFTTPGDVQDFALDKLGGIKFKIGNMLYIPLDETYRSYNKKFLDKIERKGCSRVYIPVTKGLKHKLIEYIQKGKQNEEFAKGGTIKIKKKNKGKFTESAKRAGKSVQEHARDVVNDPKATKLQKRRALFALNAKKFKHQNGGTINYLNIF